MRINEPIAEGKVVRGSAGLDVGDRVRVELVHVNPERGFIDFARTASTILRISAAPRNLDFEQTRHAEPSP